MSVSGHQIVSKQFPEDCLQLLFESQQIDLRCWSRNENFGTNGSPGLLEVTLIGAMVRDRTQEPSQQGHSQLCSYCKIIGVPAARVELAAFRHPSVVTAEFSDHDHNAPMIAGTCSDSESYCFPKGVKPEIVPYN